MLTFESSFTAETQNFSSGAFPVEKILYFDIETTGLSADTSSLYLIGCLYYRDAAWHILQWFADDYQSEAALLTSFFSFMKEFDILVHYNGSGFDLPYLQKKCRQHRLSFSFDKIQSLDIYKELFPYKKLFSLPDFKQKTLEKALGIYRKDTYDGGQLIHVYVEYIHKKLKQEDGCSECLSLLLLHNKEDLEGLFGCSVLLLPPRLERRDAATELSYQLTLPYALEKPLLLEKEGLSLQIENNIGILTLLPFTGELKYFYRDYKNYYYLPLEDTAIHKSIAEYVDRAYRERAKASNCYSKRKSRFLPVPSADFFPEEVPLFYQTYRDKTAWFEVTEEFLKDPDRLLSYLKARLTQK